MQDVRDEIDGWAGSIVAGVGDGCFAVTGISTASLQLSPVGGAQALIEGHLDYSG